MLICPDKKFIFFKPMKCAGTSVEHALLDVAGNDAVCAGSSHNYVVEYDEKNYKNNPYNLNHAHAYPDYFYRCIIDPELYTEYTHITVVRNPWDMMVSYYWWCIKNPASYDQAGGSGYHRQCLITGDEPNRDICLKFENSMTLATGYDTCSLAKDLGFADAIASPLIYASMIGRKFLDNRINCYLRYENLQNDYNKLCKAIGVESTMLPHHKRGVRKLDLHYSQYFTDWMRDEVEYYFGDYIEKFGYEFENGV